jgi:tape measure domain-containing protein|nr:MAG TPA_asm: tail tape measure [Caudoviricetes sp.]
MSETINLQAVISAKDSGYTKAMQAAENASEKLRKTTELTSSQISKASAIGNIAAGVITKAFNSITSSIGGAVKRLDTMNNFPKVMQSMGYTTGEAEAAMNKLGDSIDGLPTTLDGIVSSAQTLTASLGDLKSGTSTAIALNDMFLSGGQGAEAASRALIQYNQILAKGKVDQQSWNTLVEVAPAQMGQLAQSLLGATAGQKDLYEALKAGTISVEDMNNAVIKLDQEGGEGFSSFAEQARAATGGIGTAWSNIATAVTKGVANVVNAMDTAAKAATGVNIAESLDILKQGINTFFSAVADVAGKITSVIAPVFKFLGDNIDTVTVAVGSLVAGIAGIKAVSFAKAQIQKFSDAINNSKERINNYATALRNYGAQSEAVKNAEEQRRKATQMQRDADKAAKAATEASTLASKAQEKALKAKKLAEESSGKATQKGANYSKLKAKADKQQKAAAEMAAKAEQKQAAATQQNVTANMAEAGAATLSIQKLTAKELILGVLTGQLSIATVAQEGFNRVMKAAGGPVGLAIAAISGLVAVLKAVSSALGGESESAKKYREEQEALNESAKSHIDSFRSIKQELDGTSERYDKAAKSTDALAEEVITLSNRENKSADDKTKLQAKVDALNSTLEGLNLTYDSENDKLSMSAKLLKEKVKAIEKQQKAAALQEAYNKTLEEMVGLEYDLNKQLDGVHKKEENLQKLRSATGEVNPYAAAIAGGNAYLNVLQSAEKAVEDQQETYNKSASSYYDYCELKRTYAEQLEAAQEELAKQEKERLDVEVQEAVQAMQQKQAALDEALANHSATLDMLSEKNQGIVTDLNDMWQGYVDNATNMFDTLSDTTDVTVQNMIDNLSENQRIITEWGDNMQALRDRFAELGLDTAILDQFQEMGPEGAAYVAQAAALIDTESEGQLATLANTYANGASTATESFYNGFDKANQEKLDSISNLVTQAKETMSDSVSSANFREVSESALDGLIEGFSDDSAVVEQVRKLAKDAGVVIPNDWQINSPSKKFQQDGMYAVQGLQQGITKNIRVAESAARNLGGRTKIAMESAMRGTDSIGYQAMMGFRNGLAQGAGSVLATAQSIANQVAQTMRKALDVHSPSRVLKKIGEYAAKGLAIGLEQSRKLVEKASAKLAEAASSISFDNRAVDIGEYAFAGELAFAGGATLEVAGLREEIRELKKAILQQPIKVDSSFSMSGRQVAKGTATYMREEFEKADKIKNNVGGIK